MIKQYIKKYIKPLKTAIEIRDMRERLLILLMVCAVTYLFWTFFFDRPLSRSVHLIDEKIATTQTSLNELNQRMQMITDIVNKNAFIKTLAKKNNLNVQSQNIKDILQNFLPKVISSKELPKITTAILNQQGVVLISLKNLPTEPLIAKTMTNTTIPAAAKNIYKYNFELNFNSQYFAAIDYLSRLEKLPWQIYWDSIDYKVTEYPNALVTVKFHVLMNNQSGVT